MTTNVEIVYPGPPGPVGPAGPASRIIVSDTPPTEVEQGLMWWDSDSAILFIWYVEEDGSSSQWVQVNLPGPPGTSMLAGEGAPATGLGSDGDSYFDTTTGDIYVKAGGAWTATGDNIFGTIPAEIEADADRAENAAVAAEAARDAAVTDVGIFPTTTAGLAASPEGGYFWVTGATVNDPLLLYREVGGVATPVATYPSGAQISALSATIPAAPSTVVWGLLDANDNAAFTLRADGEIGIAKATITNFNGLSSTEVARRLHRTVRMRSSIAHWISYGQSLAIGNNSNCYTFPGSFFDSVMFNANGVATAGPRAQDGGADAALNHASFVPYEERPITGTAPSANIETPLGNAIHIAKSLLIEENGIYPADEEYVILGSAPGQSNTAIDGLDKGSSPYNNRLLPDVTYGLSLATAAGKSFAVDGVFWSQGEADVAAGTSRDTYKTALLTLYTDMNTDIKAITGQQHDIKLIAYADTQFDQTNNNIALAQVDAAIANPNIHIALAKYAIEHSSATNVHPVGLGYTQIGAYYGYCAKRTVLDGEAWPVFIPSRITRQGTILDVEFPDTGYPIAISDYLFPTQPNAGLTAIDGALADNPITSVAVIGKRRIRVVLTNAVAGKLRYCFAPPAWGGNLHNLNPTDHHSPHRRMLYQPVLPFEVSFT